MIPALEISFVVNASNTERFVGDCLRSIFAQIESPPFETIVMDDCSADARRCYWEMLRRRPQLLLRPGVARHFAGTLLGRGTCEHVKTLLRSHKASV